MRFLDRCKIDNIGTFRNATIIFFYSFITGFPTETMDDVKATINLMLTLVKENSNARVSPLYNFIPYPGTELFDVAVKHGYVPPDKLEGWSEYTWDKVKLPYRDKKIFESLYFTSAFLDKKFNEYAGRKLKTLAALYRPLARFRTKNLFFRFMLEKKLWERLSARYG